MIWLLLLAQGCVGRPRVDPLVGVGSGLVQGVASVDGSYSMFLGMPYATVDRSNPFGAAIPHGAFNGTVIADDDSAVCPHVDIVSGQPTGTLDCLNINIFVPNQASPENPLPVMVFIHGGAWAWGSGNRATYGPDYLVRKGVILVTMNYRVQIYGFMCLGSNEVPGNQGLKDQLIALRWIKEHIHGFGGNRDKITLFGHSAGGMSTHLHILSPQEKLFHRAIVMSGVWHSPWSIVEPDATIPLRLASHLGFQTSDSDEALRYLATVDTKVLVKATCDVNTLQFEQPFTKPCVERQFEGEDHFITNYPYHSTPVEAKDIPIMIGYSNNELLYEFGNKSDDFYEQFSFKDLLKFGLDSDDFTNMVDYVRRFYVGDNISANDTMDGIINLGSDYLFNYPIERALRSYLELGGQVYQYLFTYNGGLNLTKNRRKITSPDAAHGDDLGYLFPSPQYPAPNDEDAAMIDTMTTLWTNFAKFGDPTPSESQLQPWPAATLARQSYLQLDRELLLRRSPLHARMAFWDLFYRVYGHQELGRRRESLGISS